MAVINGEIVLENMEILEEKHSRNGYRGSFMSLCKCKECGNIKEVHLCDVKRRDSIRCENCRELYLNSFIGTKINMITVLYRVEGSNPKYKYFRCQCDCGKILDIRLDHLKTQESCGCEQLRQQIKHGKSETRLYDIFRGMYSRCYNPKNDNYERYGERGIGIYQEWLDDFMTFYNWAMENGYVEGLSIDRIDNNRGYSPDNCRWATNLQQNNNKENNIRVNMLDRKLTLPQVAEIYGVEHSYVSYKYNRSALNVYLKEVMESRGEEFDPNTVPFFGENIVNEEGKQVIIKQILRI